MNIILCYPPQRIYEGHGQGREWFPIGIASIAANLFINQDKVICLDLFEYSEENALQEILKYCVEDDINLVGFTMLTEQRIVVIDLCEKLKNPFITNYMNIKTVVGGPHASIMWQQLLDNYSFIDHILKGEGENNFNNLLNDYRENNVNKKRFYNIPPLEDLNLFEPAVKGLKYFKTKINMKEAPIIFSRGCTDNCAFCSTNKTWYKYRTRSAYNIYSEMLLFEHEYGTKYFKFHDDSATANENELIKLCLLMKNKNWNFEMTARADQFTPELIKHLKKAGLKKVALGLETGNDKLRRDMGKNLDMKKAKDNIRLLKSAKIEVHILLIVGWPNESEETIIETCKMIKEIKPDSFSKLPALMVLPGTPIYNKFKKEKWIDDNYWLENKPCPYYTGEQTIETLIEWGNKINNCMNYKKVLIAAVVNQDEEIFKEYLDKLKNQTITENIIIEYFFILHNSPELKKYLKDGQYVEVNNNLEHDFQHNWDHIKFKFMADMKNKIVEIAIESQITHIFWVDSDLILHPKTLQKLSNYNLPIVSEIFWTEWINGEKLGELPNCWDIDQYSFFKKPDYLKNPGLYLTGGTGACILVDVNVYKMGVNYTVIPNVSFTQWEDRAFSIRANVLNIPLYIDTNYPCKHLYTEELKEKYFKKYDKMELKK